MATVRLLVSLLLAGQSLADLHHVYTSSFATPHLYALEFDDNGNTLTDIANISAHDGHPWISFSYDKSSLYAGEQNGFASYNVLNSTSLKYSKSIKVDGQCGGAPSVMGSQYVIAGLRTPFTVFGATSTSCGAVMTVDYQTTLQQLVQTFRYRDGSVIKGMALDPESRYLYSADFKNNGIWVHMINEQGTVAQLGFTQLPVANAGPRKLVVHPDGKYLYVLNENVNSVMVFAINSGVGYDKTPLTHTGVTYNLLPKGATASQFKADEVLLSADANILYATTRNTSPPPPPPPPPKITTPPKQPQNPWGDPNWDDDDDDDFRRRRFATFEKRQQSRSGYITAILLTSLSEHENPIAGRLVGSGFPIRPMLQLATTGSGGLSNAISPAPWGNNFFAMADSELGMVEIWKVDGVQAVSYTGALAEGAATPAKGGWIQNNWKPEGALLLVEPQPTTSTTATPKATTAQPTQTPLPGLFGLLPWLQPQQPQPKQANQPKQSNQPSFIFPFFGQQNQGQGKQSGAQAKGFGSFDTPPDPWAVDSGSGRNRGDRSAAGESSSGNEWNSNELDDDDDDFDRKRRLSSAEVLTAANADVDRSGSKIATLLRPRNTKRQELVVSAKVVATWKAPEGGGDPGRRLSAEEQLWSGPPRKRVVQSSNGNRNLKRKLVADNRRDLADGELVDEEPLVWEASEQVPPGAQVSKSNKEAYIKAAKEGKSCCTNVIWYD